MRVLVVLTETGSYGGTFRFLERLFEVHRRRGIDTVLLVPAGEPPGALTELASRYRVDLRQAANRNRPGTFPLATPLFDLAFCWRTIRSCRPDLVLVSTADPGRMSVALYLPVPVLYLLHSVPEHRFRILPRWYLGLGARLGNIIATVSGGAADLIAQRMGIPRGRISVLHNSCPCSAATKELDREPLILTAGHVVGYKNPQLWLETARLVLKEHPQARFVWLGDGPLLDDMRRQVRDLSLQEQVLFTGYVADTSSWYRRAEVYLQPSQMESHGIAVLEAMAHRLPCVVSNVGGLPDSVLDGETGYLCPPGDAACFARRILELLADPSLRERLGRAGVGRVVTEFSPESQERGLMDLYRRLLSSTGEP
ncbi:glycosyltransferase family 4 protein [Geomonas propionica]|uniref:Glycosyltransferase family 4 protein n=1 Tax=Geomonas propionica TaxID=2798582 RepID=A0ABS0YP08_9BACT|nr:glycosyltransferase family 4 protein [Geomonas propionica]MBJ6799235.1 glycosyltransferase family 4 protein [Geomonas propionica]